MKLQLRCFYHPELAGGPDKPKGETFPIRLHAFATHELRRDKPAAALLFGPELADAEHRPRVDKVEEFTFDVTIDWTGVDTVEEVWAPLRSCGAYTFAQVGRLFEPKKISRSARVVFNAYSRTFNPERQDCWVRVGSTSFTIDQLRTVLKGEPLCSAFIQNAIDVDPMARRTNDIVRIDEPLLKGTITLLSAQVLGGSLEDFESRLLPVQPTFDMSNDAQLKLASREMNYVIDRHMATFFAPNAPLQSPSISPLIRFHAPVTLKDQVVMPSLGMVMNRSPKPPPLSFFINAARIICTRRGVSAERLIEIGDQLFGSGAMPKRADACAFYSFAAALVSLFANSLAYIEDFANRNKAGKSWHDALVEGDEDNKIARMERADDCEGLALEIFMVAMDLYSRGHLVLETVDPSETDLYRLLVLIVRLLRLYVPGLMFGAVTNVKLEYGSATTMTPDNTLAHTYCCFLPFDKFMAMQTPETLEQLSKTMRFTDLDTPRSRALLQRLELPIMIGEGTATVESTMLPIDLYYPDASELQVAASASATKTQLLEKVHSVINSTRLQTELITLQRLDNSLVNDKKDMSPFYKWVNGFSTSAFAESRILDFAFYYKYQSGRKTYGVRFNDLVLPTNLCLAPDANRPAVGLLPTIKLTEREAAVIDNILAMDEAVPRLVTGVEPQPTRQAELPQLNRGTPTASTLMHSNRILLSVRVEDLGNDEVEAINRLAKMHNWAEITHHWHHVAQIDVPNLEPVDILDVVYVY